jgi:hypothetical protein
MVFIFSCQKEVSYETGSPSHGSLQSASGECLPSTVNGNYIAAKALNDSNYVDVTINVTQPGTYQVITDTIDGYSFSASGTFSATGTNVVRLKGTGMPQAQGTDNFLVKYDTTICSFSVTVLPAGTVDTTTQQPQDHFILSQNSNWTYNDIFSQGDTVRRTIVGTASTQTTTYVVMREESPRYTDSLYFRKDNNNYYELTYPDSYASFQYDTASAPPPGDFLFLKEGLNTNDTWSSQEYSGTVTDTAGTAHQVKLKYVFTCTDANATDTENGLTFTSVYKVTMKSQISIDGAPYIDDLTWTTYYAKGVGIIYQSVTDGTNSIQGSIRRYQVY